jgi:hypothetical protein
MYPVPALPRQLHGSGRYHFVRPGRGALQRAIDAVSAGTTIYIAPGDYDEAVVIPGTKPNLTLIATGGRGSVAIAPSADDADGLTVHADDVTLMNIGAAAGAVDAGAPVGLHNTGRRLRAYGCKFEGGAAGAKMAVGGTVQIDAGTQGKGDDCWLVDCEFAWSDVGLLLVAGGYGAVTQLHVQGGLVHNCVKGVAEAVGPGASAPVLFRNLTLDGVTFDRNEDGTEPTNYIDLNGDNTNTGLVVGCRFPSALNSTKNLVSTAVLWVGNVHPAGLSTGQPS